jgi:hypothetical protein
MSGKAQKPWSVQMMHLDEDTLLKFVLETLEGQDRSAVAKHLAKCERCAALKQTLQMRVDRLATIDMDIDVPRAPRIGAPESHAQTWRWVAVLVVGFLLGYLSAHLSDTERPIPVPQRLTPVRMASPSGYFACPASDLKAVPGL